MYVKTTWLQRQVVSEWWLTTRGWDDILDWYREEKTVEDTIEIILMTPNKNDYNEDRDKSNQYLKMANYAVTAIMFNHVISGIEAVITNQRQARKKA